MSSAPTVYDVVIVGAGASGSIIAKQLGLAGKKVLVLEAGAGVPPNINAFMQRFYTSVAKTPESPYTPDLFTPPGSGDLTDPSTLAAGRPTVLTLRADNWQDPHQAYLIQQGPKAFASTYERVAGGTMRHWLGTSLRFLPNDFQMQTKYHQEIDWPLSYADLEPWYGAAESEIGVSADAAEQSFLGITFPPGYAYPMQAIPHSLVDDAVDAATQGMTWEGLPVSVTGTPAGRNSQPYQNRRVCAGNTNCIPICPIQAKYDPSVSLNAALDTGNVTLWPQTVASHVRIADDDTVSGIDYLQYQQATGPATGGGTAVGKVYVIAAHAIETPRLLLMSTNDGRYPNGVANSSGCVGQNLMDHPLYLAWALAPKPIWPYRGPLATAGIESLRDGDFRSERAAFRIEIGNEGWNFAIGDPDTTTVDFINGMNASGLNPPPAAGGAPAALWGSALVAALNDGLSRQFRLGFLVEQSPESSNYVSLSDELDPLGLPRPAIHYDLSDYTKKGFVAARQVADAIFARMGATQFTAVPAEGPTTFDYVVDDKPTRFRYFGAGHIVGTYRMGSDKDHSVVDADQRSWDHANLF
ncbi:MAG TPA: GMC family oxidoreductase, partial [Tahibacter sp.]|nr:GMC family oxidoreductase [Tahibacter sp.]